MTQPILHTDAVRHADARPDKWMVFLAGIYGAGRNWGAIARKFVQARPDWGILLTDVRGHGQSPTLEAPHTLGAVVADLDRTLDHLGLPVRAILGHSFGGKVALTFARAHPEQARKVWVVDSTPEARAPEGSAWGMLRVLRLHPGPFPSRAEGIAAVRQEGYAEPVAQWMSTNLVPEGDQMVWRLDPDVMEALLRDFFATDRWDVVDDPPSGMEIYFLKATESSVLSPAAEERIRRDGARTRQVYLFPVEGGHWLNADNPEAVLRLLVEHMDDVQRPHLSM